nr:MAG TPA: hypothetical protein [Caudoviricetes sp.]
MLCFYWLLHFICKEKAYLLANLRKHHKAMLIFFHYTRTTKADLMFAGSYNLKIQYLQSTLSD